MRNTNFKLIYFLILILVSSCNSKPKSTIPTDELIVSEYVKTDSTIPIENEPHFSDFYDSLENVFVDTTTLEGKREYILNQFLIWNAPSYEDFDTLFDLNYDGIDDYVIGYYGQCGTGLKNSAKVYLFNPLTNSYFEDSTLTDLPNPSYYIKDKTITSFYLPYGAGHCNTYKWINQKWQLVKSLSADNNGLDSEWKVYFPLTNKKKTIKHPYVGIPSQDFLRNKYGEE